MEIYVLIIWLGVSGGVVIQQEFYGLERCEVARKHIVEQNPRSVNAQGCYKK